MAIDFEQLWVKLTDYPDAFFYKGVIVRFRTFHTAGNGYKYAIATMIDNRSELSFVGMDGGTWGYGRCELPKEARYEDRRGTISREWLIKNFDYIAEPSDTDDISVCPDALDIMFVMEAHEREMGSRKN